MEQEPPPKRRGRVHPVGREADHLLRPGFAAKGFADPRLVLDWPAIAGADIARICLPLKLSSGVLTLKCEPGAATFLQMETRHLCTRINTYLGELLVERLKFVQAPLMEKPVRHPRPIVPTAPPPGDPALRFSGPEALRIALLNLARARRSRV